MEQKIDEDRLSYLPDALLHQIFSHLDMTVVVGTSTLSTKWRFVWRSTPILNFSVRQWMSYYGWPENFTGVQAKFQAFMDFVDKVLLLGGDSQIKKFNVYDYDSFLDACRVHSWIVRVLERHVEQLCIDIPIYGSLDLPDDLFTVNLRDLKLHVNESSALVRLPSSLCTAARLENLELYTVLFPQGNASRELELSCPLLKNLKIDRCDLTHLSALTISSPLLASLKLSRLFVESEFFLNENRVCMVKMVTPNLKSFEAVLFSYSKSTISVKYSLECASSLIDANLDICQDKEKYHWPYGYHRRRYEGFFEILSKVQNVQSLQLSFRSIEMLTDFPEIFQQLPDVYPNLKKLTLMASPLRPLHVHSVFNVLVRLPCLQRLLMQSVSELWMQTYKEKDWALNEPFSSMFSCLKSFEIQNFRGLKGEMKFLGMILKRAILLEKMTIKTPKSVISDKKLRALNDRLMSIPRPFSSATISFLRESEQ